MPIFPSTFSHMGNLFAQCILSLQELHRIAEAGGRIQDWSSEAAALIQCNPVVRSQTGKSVFEIHIRRHGVRLCSQ